jgi:hypothetical protein
LTPIVAAVCLLLFAGEGRPQDAPPDGVQAVRLNKAKADTIRLKADTILTWDDDGEIVYLLTSTKGKSVFEQGLQQVWAEAVVVWQRTEGFGPERKRRVSVFALKPSVELDGKRFAPPAFLLETESDRDVELGRRPEVGPAREHAAYVAGMKTRRKPVPVAEKPAAPRVAAEESPKVQPIKPIDPAARVRAEEVVTPAKFAPPAEEVRPAVVKPAVVQPSPKEDAPVVPVRLQPERDPPLAPPAGGGTKADPKGVLPAPSKSFQVEGPVGTDTIPLVNPGRPKIAVGPRGTRFQVTPGPVSGGEQMLMITGGVRVTGQVRTGKMTPSGLDYEIMTLDLEADRAVYWRSSPLPQGEGPDGRPEFSAEAADVNEFYLAGNVVFRYGTSTEAVGPDGVPVEPRVIRADEVYYNAATQKAIARRADVEIGRKSIPQPARVKARELWLLSPDEYRAFDPEISASSLPSDPGLKLTFREADIVRRKAVRTNVFGVAFLDRVKGAEIEETETTFEGRRLFVELGDVPVFYLPYLAGDVRRPLGPLNNIGFRQDRQFGSQIYTTWSVFELLALKPLPGENWTLALDYLSDRGPGIGTDYRYTNAADPDSPYKYRGMVTAYGLKDKSTEFLGVPRPIDYEEGAWRGRFLWRHQQEISDTVDVQAQIAYLSDRTFLEQFYKFEFDQGPNQETFVHVKHRDGPLFLSGLVQPYFFRTFANEVNWLPKVQGAWLGQDVFDAATYHAWGSVGYAEMRQVDVQPPPTMITERPPVQAGRFDLMQELLLPIQAGPVKVTPYGKVDTAFYTEDRQGNQQGRFYGGLGTKAALPFSRLYEDVESDVFNLKGLHHKVTLTANYYSARADSRYTEFPLLDRIYDDATDQSRRNFLPFERFYVPGPLGLAIGSGTGVYDPQRYLIRRQVDIHPESLDNVQVLRVGADQRLQTKRGYPGMEHTVDYLTFNAGISYFPHQQRDNFGKPLALLDYEALWFLGDRTALRANGWVDPFEGGARYFSFGGSLTRPDDTNLTVDYDHIDPLGSRLLSGSVGYAFSPKYAIRFFGNYDFGVKNNYTVGTVVTRRGTDLSMSFGFNYTGLINNFGVVFELVPNLIASRAAGRASLVNALGGGPR